MRTMIRLSVFALMLTVFTAVCYTLPAMAGGTAKLDSAADTALKKLYANNPAARELSKVAKGVLVFPVMRKVGLIYGGQYGEGVLRIDGKTDSYYNSITASYGLQAGVQKFAYVLFFMDTASLEYLNKSAGLELGVGPSIVIVDEGMAKSLTTTTTKEGIYAFIFSQKGLMAGLGIQGSKITNINPR